MTGELVRNRLFWLGAYIVLESRDCTNQTVAELTCLKPLVSAKMLRSSHDRVEGSVRRGYSADET